MADLNIARAGARLQKGDAAFQSPRPGRIARFARWLHTHKRFQRRFIFDMGWHYLPYMMHPYEADGSILSPDADLSKPFGIVTGKSDDGTIITVRIGDLASDYNLPAGQIKDGRFGMGGMDNDE